MKNVAGRVILFTLAGALAGLLTWVYSDLSTLIHFSDKVTNLSPKELQQNVWVLMAFGVLLATALGTADSLASGVIGRWWLIPLMGIPVGFVAVQFGMLAFKLYAAQSGNPATFLWNVVVRAFAWGIMGTLLGTADGWRKLSLRVGRNGAIGGLLGGLLGGAIFELIPYVVVNFSSPGIISRLLGFVIMGAAIGLFIALVQNLLKEAWLEVVLGRNEGREYLVEKSETKIGRAELADVPLFGNPAIARIHAILLAQPNSVYILRDTSEKPGSLRVNNETLQGERLLKNGDRIQIADRQLVFHERLTKAYTQSENRDVAARKARSASAPVGSVSANVAGTSGSHLASLSNLPQAGTAAPLPLYLAQPTAMTPQSGVAPMSNGGSRLMVVSGSKQGQAYSLFENAVAGRETTLAIPLPEDAKSSRNHARFVRDSMTGGYVVEDLGSTNGTFVNGQRIQRQPLMGGDTIVIGSTSFRYETT